MEYNSYAEFFLKNPAAMEKLRETFGKEVYSDDNIICDPRKEDQGVASVTLYGNELHIHPFDENGPKDFIIEI